MRHQDLLAGRVFLVDGVGKDVRAVHQLRGGMHDVLVTLARGELFPAVGERVLQRKLDPLARLAELRRLNALGGAARFRRGLCGGFRRFLESLSRRLHHDEQVRAVELFQRLEDHLQLRHARLLH